MTMFIALVAVAVVSAQAQTVALFRGATLPESAGAFRYWSVDDTYAMSTRQDENFGGAVMLQGGTGKKILIRFGDLERVFGPNPNVTQAALVLRQFGQGTLSVPVVSRVLVPWGEGPATKLGVGSTVRPNWGATWRERRSGAAPIGWQRPGAAGSEDVERLDGVTATMDEANGVLTIGGLGPVVQDMARAWHRNHGLLLEFSTTVDFFSSEASEQDRPRLLVTSTPGAKAPGPDLGVQLISRTPEYPRLKPLMAEEGGVSVPSGIADPNAKRWPANGEEVVYTATIRNNGAASSGAFRTRWVRGERKLSAVEITRSLQPGETMTVELRTSVALDHTDHRFQPLGLLIEPAGPDADAGNDYVEIAEGGLALGVSEKMDPAMLDWVQRNLRFFNDVLLAKSRFSSVLDGVTERVRLQKVGSDDANLDAWLAWDPSETKEAVSRSFLRRLALALGVPDLGNAAKDAAASLVGLDFGNPAFKRGSEDAFPGLTGGGDTRNEAGIPSLIGLPYEPIFDRLLEAAQLESTDLLAHTEAAALQAQLGRRAGLGAMVLYDIPPFVSVRALDGVGRPIANAQLGLWRLGKDGVQTKEPSATIQTDAQGQAELPRSAFSAVAETPMPNGRTMLANPFGRYAPSVQDATWLVAANQNGRTATTWLKVWHLVDAFQRGNRGAAIMDLRFDLPQAPIDRSTNLALQKLAKSTVSQDALAHAALTDGDAATAVALPGGEGTWIDLDLGRDRQIGEVRLMLQEGSVWPDFEIGIYQTGETEADAFPFAREVSAPWRFRNRYEVVGTGRGLSYTGMPVRGRFIRITAKKAFSGEVRIGEIEVFGSNFGG